MEVSDEANLTDDKTKEAAEEEEHTNYATAQDAEPTETSQNIMTTSVGNDSLGSQPGTSSNGSDTDSWTLLDQDEELKDRENLRIELFANRDLAVFARAAVQALELTTSLANETAGAELDDHNKNVGGTNTTSSHDTSTGHSTDSDIETINEIHTDRKFTSPTEWSSIFSQSVPEAEEEETMSMGTINSDGIPVVEDTLIPDGHNYIWSREEGVHSEDDEETEELFSTIIKKPATSSTTSILSDLTTSTYPESELPEEFPAIVKGHTYEHKPNKQLNVTLSAVVIVGIAMVLGLGIGHFLGWSERLELQEQYEDLPEDKFGEMPENLVSCSAAGEGKAGGVYKLEERIIKQLSEENTNLKAELAQYKKQLQQQDTEINAEMTEILRDRINDLLVANADLEKEVVRLRYSHTAMADADASRKGLEETEIKLKEARKTLNDISNENQQLKIAIGKARYGTPIVERARTQDLENINELRTENQDLKAQVGKIRYGKPTISEKQPPGRREDEEQIGSVDSFDDAHFRDSPQDDSEATVDPVTENVEEENENDECPSKFGDYFKDFGTTLKSSSKKLWESAKRGVLNGKEVTKIFGSIKNTSTSVLSDMWNSGHNWTETAKDIGKKVDEKLEKVLQKIPQIPKKIGPASRNVVKATKKVIKKLENSVRNNVKNAKEFLKEQLEEDPAIWTKKKAKEIEDGLKTFLQTWDLDNIFFDKEQEKTQDVKKDNSKQNEENEHVYNTENHGKYKEFGKKWENKYNKEEKKDYKRKHDTKNQFKKDYIRKRGDDINKESKLGMIKDEEEKSHLSTTSKEEDGYNSGHSPDIVLINEGNKLHKEKKDYSAWSGTKVSVIIEGKDKKEKFDHVDYDKSHQHDRYDSGYGEDDSEEDDDDDGNDDDDDDDLFDNYKKSSHNKTSTPSWIFQRAKNREDVRQQERKSDWIFSRANDRKKFHDLNAAEWHSRRSVNKVCSDDNEGDESCENIEEVILYTNSDSLHLKA